MERGIQKTQTTTLWFIVEKKSQNDYQGVPGGWDRSWEDAECFSHESLPCCLMCYCVCLAVVGGRDWT